MIIQWVFHIQSDSTNMRRQILRRVEWKLGFPLQIDRDEPREGHYRIEAHSEHPQLEWGEMVVEVLTIACRLDNYWSIGLTGGVLDGQAKTLVPRVEAAFFWVAWHQVEDDGDHQ
jgi:hypothetical protein